MALAGNAVIQVSWIGRCFGQQIRHVRHWKVQTVGASGSTLMDYASEIISKVSVGGSADFTTSLLSCLSSSYTLEQYRAQVIYPVRGAFMSVNAPGGTIGTRGAAKTANLQGGIHAATEFGGRNMVASYKIGPLAADDAAAGMMVVGLQAAFNGYAGTFTLPIPAAAPGNVVWVPCIYHKVPAFDAVKAHFIVRSDAEYEIRVKNTRTVGHGE